LESWDALAFADAVEVKRVFKSQRANQVICAIFALSLILLGIATLRRGDLNYRNYWGGLVFAPVAIAIGLVFLCMVMFRWRKLSQDPTPLRGRVTRRARRAAEDGSAIDDFDKPWRGGA
jgi:uncharacterized membrane protein